MNYQVPLTYTNQPPKPHYTIPLFKPLPSNQSQIANNSTGRTGGQTNQNEKKPVTNQITNNTSPPPVTARSRLNTPNKPGRPYNSKSSSVIEPLGISTLLAIMEDN